MWHCFGAVEHLGPKSQRFSEMAEAAGRDPGTIRRAASLSLEEDAGTLARQVEAWDEAGFEYLVCGWPAGGRSQVEEFATAHLA